MTKSITGKINGMVSSFGRMASATCTNGDLSPGSDLFITRLFLYFRKNLEKYHDSEHPVGGCQSAEVIRKPGGPDANSVVPDEIRLGREVPSQVVPFFYQG